PALLAATRDAGVAITASLELDAAETAPPPSLQLALYRVAQESLSNVVRHARGAEVFVGLERVGPELWLTVENGAPRDGEAEAGAASDQGGHGIRGMMERMASVGGSLEHGTLPGGGYRVVARAPHPFASDPLASDVAPGAEGTA
ncbi:MAG: sensor histidine kinase, partial [Actinomycetota bacterium]|nr:sensor histidine kinase [Actinomycetota bacterium]